MGGWVEKERNMKEVEVLYIQKTLGWVFIYGSLPWSWTMGEFQISVTLSHTRRAWLFHRHQWIFISDTADTLHHPDNWLPEAMLDWIAEIAGNLLIGVGITLSSINILEAPLEFANYNHYTRTFIYVCRSEADVKTPAELHTTDREHVWSGALLLTCEYIIIWERMQAVAILTGKQWRRELWMTCLTKDRYTSLLIPCIH